ncbi:MAG: Signal peptide peptidase SppA [Candidatus Nomurabacteria bacterium GW2011_GWB1_37_5]|uniref:Signal peptide peptidase SppA n=1 Tax=Candidatus Nomurabacteria bacterium GW2011_GWB1_37_5 TaxID=1618742 RepID=A0A0G0GZA1_9BACT|nr:MAG: Signal peptide peptidase SppA [Candidatus Nomurabacteria bacterium GW2011_GWB1_37_5]
MKYSKKLRDFLYGNIIGNIIILIIILSCVYGLIFLVRKYNNPFWDSSASVGDSSDTTDENCTVLGIELHGSLYTYLPEHAEGDTNFDYDTVASENIILAIKQANQDEEIKAIILEVDSSGGSPIAGEEISIAVKNSKKPVVALIREIGASASYLAISSADKIFASKYSDVGSIGVTMSYLNNVEKNRKEGYTYEQVSVGKYKDAGSPDKALTSEEKTLFLRDTKIIYENFIKAVSDNRKIPLDKVRSFADGSTVLGEKAREIGLIDEIGGLPEVEKYIEEKIGEKPEICW